MEGRANRLGERRSPPPAKSKFVFKPPIDHYQFYKRTDLANSMDSSQLSEGEMESYREQVLRFEQKMAFGESVRETFQPNDSQIFQLDYEYTAMAAEQLLSPGRNSDDSEMLENSQAEAREKVQEFMRDILHKTYGKDKQSDSEKSGGGQNDGKKTGAYPASQPFVKLSLYSEEVKNIEEYTTTREIGHLGHWAVSSCKANHGVQHLRDLELDTYWQSEGQQPHLISVRFPVKMHFSFLRFYIDEPSDESYTPEKIAIRVGTNEHDLKEVMVEDIKDLTHPGANWIYCSLDTTADPENVENANPKISREPYTSPGNEAQRTYETAFMIQLAILANHQNGRDTHIRQVQVFSPRYYLDSKYRRRCDRLEQLKLLQAGEFGKLAVDDLVGSGYVAGNEEFKTVGLTKFSNLR